MKITPRPYQTKAVRDVLQSLPAPTILQLPTGAGKTVVAAMLVKHELRTRPNARVVIIAPRREIIQQTRDVMARHGILAGILLGSDSEGTDRQVLVASPDTLTRRPIPEGVGFVVVDECHYGPKKYVREIRRFRDSDLREDLRVVGMTATPCRLDGMPLKEFGWEEMVVGDSISSLIERGYLSRPQIWTHSQPNMDNVRMQGGDFDKRGSSTVMSQRKIVGDAVRHYMEIAPGSRAVGFACSRAHSKRMARAFQESGIPSEHIDANTSHSLRREALERLRSLDTHVLWNVDIVGMGWDMPEVEVVIECRPTASLALWRQHVGRAMRPVGATPIVLDHAGNYLRHGHPEDPVLWSLGGRVTQPAVSQTFLCACGAVLATSRTRCPWCGTSCGPLWSRVVPEYRQGRLSLIDIPDRKCETCGRVFTKRKAEGFFAFLNKKYCTHKCYVVKTREGLKKHHVRCQYCNKVLEQGHSEALSAFYKRKHCNHACAVGSLRLHPSSRGCAACGKTLTRLAHEKNYLFAKRNYCDRFCRSSHRKLKFPEKACGSCGALLVRRDKESASSFKKRVHCGRQCASRSRQKT